MATSSRPVLSQDWSEKIQFNVEELKKLKVATHESNVRYQEGSYDQMLLKDLVQKFLLQQRNSVKFESMSSLSQQNQTLR